jgi:hypothetical protein
LSRASPNKSQNIIQTPNNDVIDAQKLATESPHS